MFEITIPVLNEQDTLENNVLKCIEYLRKEFTSNFTIVIVDNGSTDKTEEIGRFLAQKHSEIEFIKLSKKGVGLALRTSWNKSTADIIGYMDLDLSTDLKHLKVAYELLHRNQFDIINGSRLMKGSIVKNRSVIREIVSKTFNRLVRFLLDVKLSDGMCGFKFFKRNTIVQIINTGIESDNWFFCTEILVKGIWLDVKLKEIPVHWTDDINSKVNIVTLSLEYLKDIFRLRKEKKHFLKDNT